MRDGYLDSTVLPISHAWAHELENAVAHLQDDEQAGERLLDGLTPKDGLRGWLTGTYDPQVPRRNPIVDASWDTWAKWPAMEVAAAPSQLA